MELNKNYAPPLMNSSPPPQDIINEHSLNRFHLSAKKAKNLLCPHVYIPAHFCFQPLWFSERMCNITAPRFVDFEGHISVPFGESIKLNCSLGFVIETSEGGPGSATSYIATCNADGSFSGLTTCKSKTRFLTTFNIIFSKML